MSSKKHGRRHARESAVALLYSSEITEVDIGKIVEDGSYPADDLDFPEYAEKLVLGVAAHRANIDKHIAATSENWALDRMPVVDRAILRIAVYEMLFVDEVPVSVAIDEAVELAKAFGGEDESPRFVNGVLGRIARTVGNGEQSGDSDEASREVGDAVQLEERSERNGAAAGADGETAPAQLDESAGSDASSASDQAGEQSHDS